MSYQILTGNCLDHLRTEIAPGSVQCVVTSPPYWGLRDYGIPGVAWADGWHGVFGNEPTLAQYVTHTLEVFEGLGRVLRPDGVIWWNMGDTYASGGRTGAYSTIPQKNIATNGVKRPESVQADGNKLLIPYRVAIALQDAGWCIRQDVIWAKPSPMPESISGWSWQRCRVKMNSSDVSMAFRGPSKVGHRPHGDSLTDDSVATWADCPGCAKCEPCDGYVLKQGKWRPTTGHEVIFQITRGGNYYSDATSAAEPAVLADSNRPSQKRGEFLGKGCSEPGREPFRAITQTRNPRSVWRFSSESYAGAHFATFPTQLPFRCLTASTSRAGGCPTCGTQYSPVVSKDRRPTQPGENTKVHGREALEVGNRNPARHVTETVVSGYRPSCRCSPVLPPVPATIYDPFGGSGTTVQVAHHMGLHGICSELSGDYRGLAEVRILKRPKCLEPVKPPKKPRRVIHKQQRHLFPSG